VSAGYAMIQNPVHESRQMCQSLQRGIAITIVSEVDEAPGAVFSRKTVRLYFLLILLAMAMLLRCAALWRGWFMVTFGGIDSCWWCLLYHMKCARNV
jgi:uncharacterized membrane protein